MNSSCHNCVFIITLLYFITLTSVHVRIRIIFLSITPTLGLYYYTIFFSIKGLSISVTPVVYARKNSIIQNNIIALLFRLREVRRYDYYPGYHDKNFPLRVKFFTSYSDFVRMKTPPSDDVQPRADIYSMIHLYTRFLGLIYRGFYCFRFILLNDCFK